jgi:hypothetical protein
MSVEGLSITTPGTHAVAAHKPQATMHALTRNLTMKPPL